MSLLIPRNGYAMTSPSLGAKTVMTDPELDTSKTIADMTYDDIKAVYDQYQRSEVAHVANHLEQVMNNPQYTLSKWEIARMQSVFEKFTAKYTSPLAKAMK